MSKAKAKEFFEAYDAGYGKGANDTLQRMQGKMRAAHEEAVRADDRESICGIADCVRIVEAELEKL